MGPPSAWGQGRCCPLRARAPPGVERLAGPPLLGWSLKEGSRCEKGGHVSTPTTPCSPLPAPRVSWAMLLPPQGCCGFVCVRHSHSEILSWSQRRNSLRSPLLSPRAGSGLRDSGGPGAAPRKHAHVCGSVSECQGRLCGTPHVGGVCRPLCLRSEVSLLHPYSLSPQTLLVVPLGKPSAVWKPLRPFVLPSPTQPQPPGTC